MSEGIHLGAYTDEGRRRVLPRDDADGPLVGRRPVWLGLDEGGWDHARVHLSVLADCRVGAYHLAAYLGLVARADIRTGLANAREEQLAHLAGCSVRTIRDALVDLERWSYVLIERRPGRPSRYFVLAPPAAELRSTLFHNPGATCRGSCDPGATCRGQAQTPAPPAGVDGRTPAPPAGVDAPLKEQQKPENPDTEEPPDAPASALDLSGPALMRAALFGGDAP